MMKNLLQIKMILAALLLLMSQGTQAQTPGSLDLDFGNDGIVIMDNGGADAEIYKDVITLSDDKIVMVGYSEGENEDIILSKFNADGTPDDTFGVNGFTTIDATLGGIEQGWAVTELPNGKLLVTGIFIGGLQWNGFIMRLNADGSMDTSFGSSDGFTEFNAGDEFIAIGNDVVSQNGNDILVGATLVNNDFTDMAVFKFTQGGGVLEAFGTGGVVLYDGNNGNDEVTSIALSENGEIYLSGLSQSENTDRGVVVKLTAFGTPTSFGTGGAFVFDEDSEHNTITDLAITPDNKIVAVGTSGVYPNIDGYIFRLENDGDLDPTFSDDGYLTTDPGATTAMRLTNVFLPSSGGVLATGYMNGNINAAYAFAMSEDGSPNPEFGDNGDTAINLEGDVTDMYTRGAALQSDGGIVLGGDFKTQEIISNRLFVMRLHGFQPDGIFETAHKLEYHVYPNPTTQSFSIDFNTDEYLDSIALVDMRGMVLNEWSSQQVKYDIPNTLPNGIYLIKVSSNDYVYVTKLMVTN